MSNPAPLLQRHLIVELQDALAAARVVNLVGPRQVGKTTLVRDLFPHSRFVTLDDAGTLAALSADPIGQLEVLTSQSENGPVVIDEAQRAPGLALAIKQIVDKDRRKGQFVLTGSSDLFTSAAVADSLAGRMRTLQLWPLSASECEERPVCRLIDWALQDRCDVSELSAPVTSRAKYIEKILEGGFPEIRLLDVRSRQRLYRDHVNAIIDRDIADILAVRKGQGLSRLVDQLAARTAQELNIAELCRLLQLRHETTQNYLDALIRLGLVIRLPAWSAGEGKRDIKNAKWHLVDSGITAALRQLVTTSFDIGASPQALGGLLESYVVNELIRAAPMQHHEVRFNHWRSADQREIDVLLEANNRLIAVEVKASSSVSLDDFKSIRWFSAQGPGKGRSIKGIVFYLGENKLTFGNGLYALPVSTLWG
ncbi:MAG: hypothetical protein RL230_2387 [Pseudomonadota bacterium]